jgi:hypothetical protein
VATDECERKLTRWRSIVEQVVKDLTDPVWQREQIRLVGKMIEEHSQLKASAKPFLWEVRRWYMVFAVLAIRRQVDADDDVLSLRRVLEEIREQPECISREMVVRLFARDARYSYDPQFEKMLMDSMWKNYSELDGSFNVTQVAEDINRLVTISKEIKRLADKSIAHATKRGQKPFNLTFDDLDQCMDAFDSLAVKYIRLLTGAAYSEGTLLPVAQFDWYEQFRFAWKPLSEQ